MEIKQYFDEAGNSWLDCNLLEIAFFQFESDRIEFLRKTMFCSTDYLDTICAMYDYTDELPESELYYTTYQKLDRSCRWNNYEGNVYLVIVDALENIAIYKKLEGDVIYDD